jgi:hypothetical protein
MSIPAPECTRQFDGQAAEGRVQVWVEMAAITSERHCLFSSRLDSKFVDLSFRHLCLSDDRLFLQVQSILMELIALRAMPNSSPRSSKWLSLAFL